jgi:hypothetical protein
MWRAPKNCGCCCKHLLGRQCAFCFYTHVKQCIVSGLRVQVCVLKLDVVDLLFKHTVLLVAMCIL